jgi:hypothetical protein
MSRQFGKCDAWHISLQSPIDHDMIAAWIKRKGVNQMPKMTPKQIANEFGAPAKRVRKFLRSETPIDERPGKGGRWELDLTARTLGSMRKRFDAWNAKAVSADSE